MCIHCYTVLLRAATDDYWLPVRHKVHNFGLAAIKIPFSTKQQRARIITRIEYLMVADIPFIQQVFDYFVCESYIIAIVRRPQQTVANMLLQDEYRTDDQHIQISYSLIMAVLMLHRHRILAGSLAPRGFLVFQNQYICMSAYHLLCAELCPEWTAKQDVVELVAMLLELEGLGGWDGGAVLQQRECAACGGHHTDSEQLGPLAEHLQLLARRTPVQQFCAKMLGCLSWPAALGETFLGSLRISPLSDGYRRAFSCRPCAEVVAEETQLSEAESCDAGAPAPNDPAGRGAAALAKLVSEKHGLDLGLVQDCVAARQHGAPGQDAVAGTALQQHAAALPASLYESEPSRTGGRGGVCAEALDLGRAPGEREAETALVAAGAAAAGLRTGHSWEELAVLLRVGLCGRGARFFGATGCFPCDCTPVVPLIDFGELRCAAVRRGRAPPAEQLTFAGELVRHAKMVPCGVAQQAIACLIGAYMQLVMQRLTVCRLGRSIECQEAVLGGGDVSARNRAEGHYCGSYELCHVSAAAVDDAVTCDAGDVIRCAFRGIAQLFETVCQGEALWGGLSAARIAQFKQQHATQLTDQCKQQLARLLISFVDLLHVYTCSEVVSHNGICDYAPKHLLNFRNALSAKAPTEEDVQDQVLLLNMLILTCAMSSGDMKQLLLLNMLAPDAYIVYQKANQRWFTIDSLMQHDRHEGTTIKKINMQCECGSSQSQCKWCLLSQRELQNLHTKYTESMKRSPKAIHVERLNTYLAFEWEDSFRREKPDFIFKVLYYYVQLNAHQLPHFIETIFGTDGCKFLIENMHDILHGDPPCVDDCRALVVYHLMTPHIIELYCSTKHVREGEVMRLAKTLALQKQNVLMGPYINVLSTYVIGSAEKLMRSEKQNQQPVAEVEGSKVGDPVAIFQSYFQDSPEEVRSLLQECAELTMESPISECQLNQLPLQLSPAPLANYVLRCCDAIINYNRVVDVYIQPQSDSAAQKIPTDLMQRMIDYVCVRTHLLENEIDFSGLCSLFTCASYVILPPSIALKLFNQTLVEGLVRRQNFQTVLTMYCKYLLVFRNPEQISQTRQLVSAERPTTTKAAQSISRSAMWDASNSMNINATPNQALMAKACTIDYSKLCPAVLPPANTLGPKYFRTACAVIAELSYTPGFYTEEMEPATAAIGRFLQQFSQEAASAVDAGLATDLAVTLFNFHKIQPIDFASVVDYRFTKLLMHTGLHEGCLTFLLYCVQQIAIDSQDAEKTAHNLLLLLLERFLALLGAGGCTKATLLQAFNVIVGKLESVDAALGGMMSMCYQHLFTSSNDQCLRLQLKLILKLCKLGVFKGISEHGGCKVLIELLKAKGREQRNVIIRIIDLCYQGDQKLQQAFTKLNVRSLLRRINQRSLDTDVQQALGRLLQKTGRQ